MRHGASPAGSLVGQLLVVYFPPLQRVFLTEAGGPSGRGGRPAAEGTVGGPPDDCWAADASLPVLGINIQVLSIIIPYYFLALGIVI